MATPKGETVPASPADVKNGKLDQIVVYRDDKKEMDRLFGQNVSYAKRQQAILDTIKRERLVDKVRRKIIGAEELLAAAGRRITLEQHVSSGVEPRPAPPSETVKPPAQKGGPQ